MSKADHSIVSVTSVLNVGMVNVHARQCAEAIRFGDFAKMSSLIQAGLDPDAVFQGKSLVEIATRWSSPNALSLLASHGARLDRMGSDGSSIFAIAAGNGHLGCLELFIQARVDIERHGLRMPPLAVAAGMGHYEAMRALIDAGARIDSIHGEGRTVLMEAVLSKKKDCVKLALLHGADPNAVEAEYLMTPAMLAAQYYESDMIQAFFGSKMDPHLTNAIGESVSSMLSGKDCLAGKAFDAWMHSKREGAELNSCVEIYAGEGVASPRARL